VGHEKARSFLKAVCLQASMIRIRAVTLVLIAISLVAHGVRAQDSTRVYNSPTAPLLTGDRSVSDLGAAVTVIHVDSLLRQFPVRTLSELLTGRVPGLEVLPGSGEIGTGSRIFSRGVTSFFASSAPQIYVDGIRVDDEPATLILSVGGQTTSRVDDINVEDVATIAVLPGPAATALYGTDAANGVLLITTKQGSPSHPRFSAFTSQGLIARPEGFPDNFLAVDSTGPCTAAAVAAGSCRLFRANALENPATSPFRNGYLRQYGLNASGGGATTRYYLAAQWDGFGGVYGLSSSEQTRLAAAGGLHPETENPNYLRRVSLRARGDLLAAPGLNVTLAGGYFSDDLRLPLNDTSNAGVLANGMLGSADTSVTHGWAPYLPGDIFQVLSAQHVEQAAAGLTGQWQPVDFMTVRALLGLDLTRQHDDQLQRPGEGPNGSSSFSTATKGVNHSNRYTATVTAELAFHPFGRWRARTSVGVEYFKRVGYQFDSTGSTFGTVSGYSESWFRDTMKTTGAFVEQELIWNDGLFLTGALRRDAVRRFGMSEPVALYPHLGVAWHVPTGHGSLLSSVKLRAAYGVAGREASLVGFALKPERTRELEGGVDADLLRGRLSFSGTVYSKHTNHVVSFFELSPSAGGGILTNDSGEVTNKGIELALSATALRLSSAQWDVRLAAWGNRNRVVAFRGPPFSLGYGFGGVLQSVQVGLPVGSYTGLPIIGYADANHDGILSPSEVRLGTVPTFLGTPFPTEGATLSSTLRLRERVLISTLLDYRAGNSEVNYTEQFRCEAGNCRARNDPSTPLADQVAWAAQQAGSAAGWVERANFLKLREVAVTFLAPAAWAHHVSANQMTFTFAGRNLATWTSYRGLDPEINVSGSRGLSSADFFTQPLARIWTARLDLSF
jgi:TonB-dependent SusC/RagA subfamily outer membrane receptor